MSEATVRIEEPRVSVLELADADGEQQPLVTIVPPQGWAPLRCSELWAYRELLYFLVWRDIKVRYKQTALGVAWAVIQPVGMMVVFSLFFGMLAQLPSNGLPYPIFVYSALLPWQLFAHAMTESSNSLVGSQQLITKVYFPRLVIPLAAAIAGLVDFAIAFIVLLMMMAVYGFRPTPAVWMVPGFALLALASALAAGLWLSALNVQYRDVRYMIPFLTQVWMFATPIAYPSSLVPESWRVLYGLNPMAGVVEGFRWALLGQARPPGAMLAVSAGVVLAFLLGGLYYFRRMERTFADVV